MDFDYITAELFDIFRYEELGKFTDIAQRNFSALSFRISSVKSCFKYKNYTLKVMPGDISYVPANVKYKRTSEKEDLIVFHFYESKPTNTDIVVFTPENKDKYRDYFEKALNVWAEKKTGYTYKAASVLYEILSELINDGMQINRETDKDTAFAADEIERGFANPCFRVENLASQLYISETYLRRKFKKQFGISLKQYLMERRIKEAKIMLESGYFSQKEIAKKCGFSDVKYFRSAFKTQTGKTVKEYRQG